MTCGEGMLRDRSPSRAEALPSEVRENFPPDMLALRRYVVWRYEERVSKSAKIPHVADGTGARASSTDPATWRGFEAAARVFLVGGYDGVGFVFSPGEPPTRGWTSMIVATRKAPRWRHGPVSWSLPWKGTRKSARGEPGCTS